MGHGVAQLTWAMEHGPLVERDMVQVELDEPGEDIGARHGETVET